MFRLATAFGLCLLLAGCASAPPSSLKDSYDPYLLVQQSFSSVPLINTGNRQWQVRVEINGEPGVFAVDTGSDTPIVTPQFAQKLGLLKTAVKGRFTGPNPLAQQVRYAHLTYLRLGGILYLNFYAPILNLDHLNRALHTHLDGILGNNVLGKTACTLDWSKNLLTLNADYVAPPADAIPIAVRQHRLYLTALVNGRPVEFVLDTGAYSSSLTEKEVTKLQLPPAKKTQIKMPRADISEISPLQQTQVTLDTFQFSKINQTNFPMLTWDNNVLGMDLLEPWILTFDVRGGWISLAEAVRQNQR